MSKNIFLFTKYIILMINPITYVHGGNINTNLDLSLSVIGGENDFFLNEDTDGNLQDENDNNVSGELSRINDVYYNKDSKENGEKLLDVLKILDNNGDEYFKNIDSHKKKNLLNNMNEDNDSKLNDNPSSPPQKPNNVSFVVKKKNCCNCSACC